MAEAMNQSPVKCKVCGAKSGATLKLGGQTCCAGCGTAVAKQETKARPAAWRCPQCRGTRTARFDGAWWMCKECRAVFDTDEEVGFLDSRPFENAAKREQSLERLRHHKRQRRGAQ
jgi:ribosomal protein L37AE/L43A